MNWLKLSITITGEQVSHYSEQFEALGAVSITTESANEEEIFEPEIGSEPVWQLTRLSALFEKDLHSESMLNLLASELATKVIATSLESLEDQVWERVWLEHFKPLKIGKRLWICPNQEEPQQDNAVVVHLDPGLAFGTGHHETTALCLTWLESQDLGGKTLLDFGCGSGILAIAGVKLGAEHAIATDIDPQALEATATNALTNHIPKHQLSMVLSESLNTPPVEALVANILAKPLIQLKATISSLVQPKGHIALSGILKGQEDAVFHAYSSEFELEKPVFRGDWVLISGQKR